MAPSHSVTETDKQSFVSLKGGHARDLDNEIIKGGRDRRKEGGIFTLYLRRARHAAH